LKKKTKEDKKKKSKPEKKRDSYKKLCTLPKSREEKRRKLRKKLDSKKKPNKRLRKQRSMTYWIKAICKGHSKNQRKKRSKSQS